MKILSVKANKLLPLHSGGDIRSFHILKGLSAAHDVTFLSYYDGPQDQKYDADLRQHFSSAISVCTGRRVATLARGLDYLRRFSSPAPYAVSRFESPLVQEKIRQLLDSARFDVVIADFLDAAINLPDKLPIPAVLFQHNVESEIWRRHASTESNPVKRLMYQVEFKKMLRYEQKSVQRFQHVVAVSEHDRGLMQKWTEGSRITVVPTGVDIREYQPGPASDDSAPVVMFVGAMDWEPNIDGGEFFCNRIWNEVVAKIPDARFLIVGRNPGPRVQKLASTSIHVTGRVDSVADYLQKAAVVIVPLRIGGGTRLKIYEAMAAGKAVVSTTLGAEGLDVSPGRDIVIADDPPAFSAAVISLLKDRDLRRNYESAARVTAAKYDWSVIAAKFGDVLRSVVAEA